MITGHRKHRKNITIILKTSFEQIFSRETCLTTIPF